LLLSSFYPLDIFWTFAATNNFQFIEDGIVDGQTGYIFSIGFGSEFTDIVFGIYRYWQFCAFIYEYSLTQDEDSRRFSRTVLVINFEYELPSFVLRKHVLLQVFENENESLQLNGYTEIIHLEANVDKYFRVHINADTQIEVLSILTPDVMELVLELNKFEIELTLDGKLYVYNHKVLKSKQRLQDTFSIVASLVPKIEAYSARQAETHGATLEQNLE
jgi:hypothetical protein